MPVTRIRGNIFTSNCQTIVNTVNCYGIMGAGIALECKLRHPLMFKRYKELCDQKYLAIGKLYLFQGDKKWILNFPTKNHWKFPSKKEYLIRGLEKFIETYEAKEIESIAFPILGSNHGGIDVEEAFDIMYKYLSKLTIDVEIYDYDKDAKDDMISRLINDFQVLRKDEIKFNYKLSNSQYDKLYQKCIIEKSLNTVISVLKLKGFSEKTVSKIFDYLFTDRNTNSDNQLMLFNGQAKGSKDSKR